MIEVISKIELSDDLKRQISASINEKFPETSNQKVVFLQDSCIISGIKIIIDSQVIDMTLNQKLNRILEIIKK